MSAESNQHDLSTADASQAQSAGMTVPVGLMVLMVVLMYCGMLYFDQSGAWFSPKVYAPYHSIEEVQAFQITAGPGDEGRALYGRTCIACHQATGQGSPGQFPPLVGSEWVNQSEPGRVIRLVLQGLQGPITVKGQSFNATMVPWNSLSDHDIAAVLTYVRQNQDWGNNAPPVTPAQVKAVRDKIQKAHPGAFTPDELQKISPAE